MYALEALFSAWLWITYVYTYLADGLADQRSFSCRQPELHMERALVQNPGDETSALWYPWEKFSAF